MHYQEILVLGTVQLACQIAAFLKHADLPVSLCDTNVKASSFLKGLCSQHAVPYLYQSSAALTHGLRNTSQRTLIISAMNPYILPEPVLQNEKIKAINYHPALLPKHPGRNVEAWTIFEMDETAGVTWHFINSEVDAGKILDQRKIALNEGYTSLRLLRDLNKLALESFKAFFGDLIQDKITGYAQDLSLRSGWHYSWEVPNDGFLDLSWSGPKMSAFLRAMDYGILETLGKPKLVYQGVAYNWKRYQISLSAKNHSKGKIVIGNDSIQVFKDSYRIDLWKHYSIQQ